MSKIFEILKLRESMSDIIDCATCYENVMSTACTYSVFITMNDIIEIIDSFSSHTVTNIMVVSIDILRPIIFMQIDNAGYFQITPFTISNTNFQEMILICADSVQCYSWKKFKVMNKVGEKPINLLKAKL